MTGFPLVAVGIVAAQPPGRWLFGATGRGTARWTEDGAGLTYRGGAAFGWAVLPETFLRDGFVQARFKPIAGREDQAGGVVWRWRDADNYYVARANALEDNVVAYKVVAGRRTALAPVGTPAGTYGVKTKVAGGAWHTLRADFAGTEPGADIAPKVAAALRADGVDLGGKKPRRVTREDVARADHIVAFGCDLGVPVPAGVRVDQWADVPAVSDGLPAARAAIHAHLEGLLEEWRRP